MRRAIVLVAVAAAVFVSAGRSAVAEDSVELSRTSALLGDQVAMTIRVSAPQGATVELTPGTPGWAAVELAGVDGITRIAEGDSVLWIIEARVAVFLPGEFDFSPTVAVVEGSEARSVALPTVRVTGVGTLPADAALELTPLPEPRAIAGAESPLLRPAIAAAAVVTALLVALVGWLIFRRMRRAVRRPVPEAERPAMPPSLEGAQGLLHSDPVMAYRMMSAVVKGELARRYNLRATALTSTELRRKLEAGGDRWQARLVSGLLEECDSVIYAGYRPAGERREADLTMAREIVEAAG